MQNTFKKYTSGVYCMQSDNDALEHGDETTITTRRGKEIEVVVWKKLFTRDNFTFYSIVRQDDKSRSECTRRKVGRAHGAAERQRRISNEEYEKSQEGKEFLSLGEPVKVGHHSEKSHRALIERNNKRMDKSVEASDKAKSYESKALELERRLQKEINIDEPESLDLLIERVSDLEQQRDSLKSSGKYESYQLSNLGANIRRYKERLETAKKLWDLNHTKERINIMIIENRIEAINALHNWLNYVVPKLKKDIEKNGFKLKEDGELYKKDNDRLKQIVKEYIPKRARFHFRTSPNGGLSLVSDIMYVAGEHKHGQTANYYRHGVNLSADSFDPLPLHSPGMVKKDVEDLKDLKEARNKLDDTIRRIESLVFGR